MIAAPPEVQVLLRVACKRSMLPDGHESQGSHPAAIPMAGNSVLDRPAIEAILPHRDPFLLIDRVTLLDRERRLIVAGYDLTRAGPVFAGHFPGAPLWPGVLQVEAIGQAGAVLAHSCSLAGASGAQQRLALTQIVGAQFVRPVVPGGDLVMIARCFEDGLFVVIVGQCLQNGRVCSAAVVRGMEVQDQNDA